VLISAVPAMILAKFVPIHGSAVRPSTGDVVEFKAAE
jgi:hypothetical protein